MAIYEVFTQSALGKPYDHAGDLEAPDHQTALLSAKEHFARRDRCVSIWVVDRQHIHESHWEPEVFDAGREKRYRRSLNADQADAL